MAFFKTTLLAATASVGLALPAFAQGAGPFDPNQLPAVSGRVSTYTITPRGDVDGFLLANGIEVLVPPFDSTALVYVIRPGDSVTVHGLRTRNGAMVAAMSVTNDATHASITVERLRRGHHWFGQTLQAAGVIKTILHDPSGRENGVVLADGTQVRLPPHDAARMTDILAIGKKITVKGMGYQGPLGRMIAARSIGPDSEHMTEIRPPHPRSLGEKWRQHGPHRFGDGPQASPVGPSPSGG
ncbi:MAG: hypothetical protein KGK10_00535 [Rhodospirillales bacterium]|nr:hypothetical protein [Rhodospirillales bacterium]